MNSTAAAVIASPSGEALCLFQCSGHPLAIRLESVAEVLEVNRIVRLPLAPAEILGLCILRREVIPVVAIRRPERERSMRASTSALVLILRGDRGAWALKIDPTGTIVATEQTVAPPLDMDVGSSLVQRGTLSRHGMNYAVIDHDATWRSLKERIEGAYLSDWGRDVRTGEGVNEMPNRWNSKLSVEESPTRGKS